MNIFGDDGNYDYDFHKDEIDEEVDYEDTSAYNDFKEKTPNEDDEYDGIGCLPIVLAIIIIGGLVFVF